MTCRNVPIVVAFTLGFGCALDPATPDSTRTSSPVSAVESKVHPHRIRGDENDMRVTVEGLDHRGAIAFAAPSDANGIAPHGGPVMTSVNIYYIWYGSWANNSATGILTDLAFSLGDSLYWNINTTYYDPAGHHVGSSARFAGATTDSYSRGTSLADSDVAGVVSDAITSGRLPKDAAGVYFVLSSADVTESSGFCTKYCGWHTSTTVGGANIKYAWVGNAESQCPSACMAQTKGPNGNAGADGMASVIAHELEEAATDPNLDAWYDSTGEENADKCAWTFGSTHTTASGALANINLGREYLIQQNWVNAGGGFCAMSTHYRSIGGDATSAPAVSSWAPGRLDVFAKGADNGLAHQWFDGASWSGWESLGGTLASQPAAVSWGTGRIDVFARGTDNTLIHKWFDGGNWSGWESLGGTLASGPAAASWAKGRLDVFARGVNNTLIHKWFDGTNWSGFESLGGALASEPAAVSWSSGRLDVFARGANNTLIHQWFDGSNWSGFESLGGNLASAPAVASWARGRLDVFARSPENTLIHQWFDGGNWSGWESLGNTTLSSPAAVSWSSGRIDVFTLGEGNSVWTKWFDGNW